MNKLQNVAVNFKEGFHCSQCVLEAFSEELGIDKELALKISSCFGRGMCFGETCGAVTGAVMALGLKYGNIKADDKAAKEKTYDVTRDFCEKFKEINGSIICRELMGVDFAHKENRMVAREKGLFKEKCPKYIKDAINIVETML
ncbi:putative redox-active protein (C_GCAxxG_C_C) [Clostridium ragsdalei P11]|uniref:Putative redox-active protein (C_GCAxxG_C_C) n=1 Tax=Clostridium ragsdalei P11 TaxID=1353534 RepID=A0A1A6AKM4_9CLOT|nr:C-GCAxxG-C-C family protein [Clostridium ragsdalei]OBR90619.1 putative redox-active protein (C_GCAxxG_C_C) [Clostridium ragsdalei P11]